MGLFSVFFEQTKTTTSAIEKSHNNSYYYSADSKSRSQNFLPVPLKDLSPLLYHNVRAHPSAPTPTCGTRRETR